MSQDPRGLSWRRLPALAGLLLGLAWASPATACRCAQLPLERYFEAAEIVLVGEAVRVTPRTVDGVDALEVVAEPHFHQGRPFKGSLAGVTVVTPLSSARCGVPVEAGELYLIFASRVEPGDDLAWFDSCGGSRLYAGGARADEMTPFVGLPRNLVVPRLLELSGAAPAAADPGEVASPFHTSPAGECAGQCPCAAVPGSRTEAAEPPPSRPAPGETGAEDLPGLVRSLAYLDADWDGRVYSEPGGRVSTLSGMLAERERPEHPAEVVEVRDTPTGPWLHVRLYAGNPCTDPATPVAHAGWVPAYSEEGALVAGTHPGGC